MKQAGAWHSQDDLNQREACRPLADEIRTAIQRVFDDLLYDPAFMPHIDNMWADVSPRHAFNRMHTHPGVMWSGVYYVQTPEKSGRIFFSDPRVQVQILRPRLTDAGRNEAFNWAEVFHEPIAERLILFPSWLLHEVEPNLADEEGDAGNRINISFNNYQKPKPAT